MKKMWKRVLATVLATVLCAGTFMTMNWQTAEAEEATDGLKVIGASIRFINADTAVDGIRFAVGVKADALTDETKSNYHLLVMPTALLTDGELTKGETYSYTAGEETKYAYAQDIKIDWAKATDETVDNEAYKVVRIYLNEIGADYYTTDVTARAYYQDGENAPVYSEAIERSYYSVANAALDDLKASEVADKYDNKVGNSYSPYDATQRDALLGVKYVKTGTWDYVDEMLVQQSAKATDSLTDRVVKTGTGEYSIRTAFKIKSMEEIGSSVFGGVQFGYDPKTDTYVEFDYYKYTDKTTSESKLIPRVRWWDGVTKTWKDFGISSTSTFKFEEDTMYDFNIIVTETSTKMDVIVRCRKSGTADGFVNAINGSITYGTTVFGDQIRFYAGRDLSGNTFSSKIVYSEKYNLLDDKGKTVTTTDSSFSVSGAASGTVTATALNKKVKANNNFAMSVDMVWEDRSTTNYRDTGFQIGGHNVISQGSKGNFYFSPKGFSIHGTKYELATLAGSIPGLAKVVEKIAAGTPVTWTIVATPSTTDATNKTLITYYVDGIKCVSQEITKGTIFANYIMYHAPANVTFSNLDVNAEVPEPEDTSMYTTTGNESVLLNKTLGDDGLGTIEGQFVVDARTEGSNTRREGITLCGENGDGYFFWISSQSETDNFYVSVWKNRSTTGKNYNNVNFGGTALKVPYPTLATDGIELKDNDQVTVDFKVVTWRTASNKIAFDITTTFTCGSWKKECAMFTLADNEVGQYYTGGKVCLFSEDNGDANVAGESGDGKTIYNWIKINGEYATAVPK